MKTHQQYVALSLVTALTVIVASFGALSFAQTVTPLSCSVAVSSVRANEAAILTASGGNGSYVWSGQNLNINNSAGSKFAVSYPDPGTYTINVTSAGLSASCSFTVVAAPTGALTCSPVVQNVTLGNTATFAATGGSGTYTWSSPDLSIANPNGSGFSAKYASTGLKTLTVTSAGNTATCAVNVLLGGVIIPPVIPPVVTPGLPDTGGGFGE